MEEYFWSKEKTVEARYRIKKFKMYNKHACQKIPLSKKVNQNIFKTYQA